MRIYLAGPLFTTAERVRLCAGLGVAIAAASPLVSAMDWRWLPPNLSAYFVPSYQYFAFFPWASFIAFGLSIGSVLRLVKPDQIEVTGNHIVSREAVLQQFVRDRGRSVLRIPLDARRGALEEISWVESATVQRILPNRIRVQLTERTPIAFLRNGTELALIDPHGVILDRPRGEDLQFPIVTGLSENMPREERGKRMQTYQEFMKDIDLVRSGSSDRVSEVDLANPKDLRAVMTGIASASDPQALTIHFGSGDFTGKYRMVVENFAQWQASNGRVHSIDLQYAKQVVLNPDTTSASASKTR